MRVFALVFALVAFSAAGALAQDGEEPAQPGDAPALEACLNAASEPSTEHGRTCIGLVSQPCMAAGSYSTMEMVRCLQRERHAWDVLSGSYVARLRASETATQIERLDAYLAAREIWLEGDCGYQASLFEGGSLSGLTGEACRKTHSAEVAIQLHGRVRNYDQR